MIANEIGIIMMSFNVKLPVLDEVTDTIRIEEIIVAGIEYFLIPKFNGINAIPEAAIAFMSTDGICCMIKVLDNTSGIKSNLSLTMQKMVVIKTLEMMITLKVKSMTIASLAAINFFRLTGYMKANVIVLNLYSPMISLAINVAAKIINTALTNESMTLKAIS